ncbi:MAG: hypothetical protein JRG76_03740 [Deltaproteobacteria bacterium]|nr:hypothetical protein [Deltaproteobacteria bacterium]MBW2413602.1 hypothetical protein [Deltaproteobacteria bacterium]
MAEESFAPLRALARELADRDRDLPDSLAEARAAAERLRERAVRAVEAFCDEARERGAEHLGHIDVGAVEPDDKHVDAVQLRLRRGRWEIVCVAKACGQVTLVGPYKRYKAEKPCLDVAFDAPELEASFDGLLLELLREATAR